MLAAGAHALLRSRGARVVAALQPQKHILELIHPRIGEQQRGIVGRHERRRVHAAVPLRLKELQEGFADGGPGPLARIRPGTRAGRHTSRVYRRERSYSPWLTPPTRTFGPVGHGIPPLGSTVTANAFAAIPGGTCAVTGSVHSPPETRAEARARPASAPARADSSCRRAGPAASQRKSPFPFLRCTKRPRALRATRLAAPGRLAWFPASPAACQFPRRRWQSAGTATAPPPTVPAAPGFAGCRANPSSRCKPRALQKTPQPRQTPPSATQIHAIAPASALLVLATATPPESAPPAPRRISDFLHRWRRRDRRRSQPQQRHALALPLHLPRTRRA